MNFRILQQGVIRDLTGAFEIYATPRDLRALRDQIESKLLLVEGRDKDEPCGWFTVYEPLKCGPGNNVVKKWDE